MTNLDLDLLRSFVAVVDAGGFSRAAERLRRGQSTVSLQIQRLEDQVGAVLLQRTPRHLSLTAVGEAILDHARRMLALNDALIARAREPALSGTVRLGAPEDFATQHLPAVLARFADSYPAVTLEVTCDLTLNLLDGFGRGAFDLVLIKQAAGAADAGVRVWREPLVWAAGSRAVVRRAEEAGTALPLVVSPRPCVYRMRATEALDAAGKPWRIVYTCGSLAGTHAAVRAGLGITVLPQAMVPPDFIILDTADRSLPDLHDTEMALLAARPIGAPAQRLHDHIIRALEHR